MIEVRNVPNRVLARLIEHDDSIRQYVNLREQLVGTTLRSDRTYFPVSTVFALVTSDGLDAALVRANECTWFEPCPATLETRLTGYSYTVPTNLLRTPSLMHVLTTEAAKLHCQAIESLSLLSCVTKSHAVAGYLVRLGQDELPITQQVVAQAVGVRRETVTEVFARFERSGWLQCSRSRVVILDREALQNYAVGSLEAVAA